MVRSQTVESFVARIWLERAEGQAPRWRGHIQHIQGSEETYFQNLAEVSEFLERVSGVQGPDCSAGQATLDAARTRGAASKKAPRADK